MGSLGRCRRLVVMAAALFMSAGFCGCQGDQQVGDNSFVASTVVYPDRWLGPYDWTYIRVEVPPWFSSLIMNVQSDINVGKESIDDFSNTKVPAICFRSGGLPLPDVSANFLKGKASVFNGSTGGILNLRRKEQCFPFQKNVTVTLTNEQISSGVWYIGYFNGLGPTRTQSKMISRGRSHTFSTTVNIIGCIAPAMWGPYCNQTIIQSSCYRFESGLKQRRLLGASIKKANVKLKHLMTVPDHSLAKHLLQPVQNFSLSVHSERSYKEDEYSRRSTLASSESNISCNNSINMACLGNGEVKILSLDVVGPTSLFRIVVTEVNLNQTSSVNSTNSLEGAILMCYVRYNAVPSKTSNDYFGDISHSPLVIQSPEIGRWYIAVHAVNQTKGNEAVQERDFNTNICFSFEWQVYECPYGKVGPNCMWEGHILQRIMTAGQDLPFGSYYLPVSEDSTDVSHFSLEPLLSNNSINSSSDIAWTYFLLEIPPGSGGSNMHIKLISERKIKYEVYSKFGGLPSMDDWDYFANSTISSNNSMMLTLDESSEESINFYIIYPNEGKWNFGIKHSVNIEQNVESFLSIAIEKCPRQCSSHGKCKSGVDESGMTIYSFCSCDVNHGGFDCSIELVSPQGHIWQSISLIASNGAAILPAFWALRQKAFAEWVIFTCSGISSGLYHACDVGTWCPLGFHVLQFMDFWLSFLAVVSTFVYMTTISESSKRAILAGASILTALLAVNGPTRSVNIVIVLAIGALGLIVGWMIEFSRSNGRRYFSDGCSPNISVSWQNARRWPRVILAFLLKRYRWPFILLGSFALSAAAVSWKLETSESYWIWHSIWHVTIYTSSFFFLSSIKTCRRHQEPMEPEHELTRQNSSSRDEPTGAQC